MAPLLRRVVAVVGLVVMTSLATLLVSGKMKVRIERDTLAAQLDAASTPAAPLPNTPSASLATPRAKAYVHIGPHKTGTTSFQTWLSRHGGLGDLLLPGAVTARAQVTGERGGGKSRAVGVKDFAFGCAKPLCSQRDSLPPEQSCPLLTNIPEGRNLVISSEEFDACRAPGLQNLRGLLKEYEVEIIVVHRLYSDHVASYYNELEKGVHGPPSTLGFRDWLVDAGVSYVANADPCKFVSTQCIELLASVFGARRVHVVSYDGAKAAGRSLVDVVACDVAKLPCEDGKLVQQLGVASQEQRENVAAPHEAYSASALFNQAAKRLQCTARIRPKNRLARNIYKSAAAATLCLPVEDVTEPIRKSHSLCDSCFHAYLKSATVNSYMFDKAPTNSTRLSCELNASSPIVQTALDRVLSGAGCTDLKVRIERNKNTPGASRSRVLNFS